MTTPIGSVSVRVVPDAQGFQTKLAADLDSQMRELGAQMGRDLGSSMADALSAELDRMKADIDELGLRSPDVRVKVNDDGSIAETRAKIDTLGSSADDSGGSVDLLGSRLVRLGLLAVAGADVAIPALLAIGAAAGGILAGIGVLGLGFSGIGSALSAANSPTSGGSSGGSGSSAALQAIEQKEQAQSATDQLTQAIEAQQQAEQSLTKAQQDATTAQANLTAAREQAKEDLQDLNNQVKDNALAQRQAALTLAQAQSTLLLTKQAPGAGLPQYAGQVASAQLSFDEAQQNLSELQLQGSRLGAQQKTSTAQGVNGSPGVVSAQQQLAAAQQSVASAQQGLADSGRKVAEAQQNIADTAAKAALQTEAAAGSTDDFASAMAKLNPLQQQFVEFLLPLKPLFDDLKTAASGFLPGLEAGITDALPAFQPLLNLVSQVAKTLGGIFDALGTAIGSPAGQKFLTFLATELPQAIGFVATLFGDVGQIIAGVLEAAAPLITAIEKALETFFGSAAKGAESNGLAKFFSALIPLINPVEKFLETVAKALGGVLSTLAPAIAPLATALGSLIAVLTPLLPLFGQLISDVLPPLAAVITQVVNQGLVPFVQALVTDLEPVLPEITKAFDQLVTALAPLIIQIIQELIPFLPGLIKSFVATIGPGNALLKLFLDLATLIATVLVPVLGGLASMFNTLAGWTDTIDTKIQDVIGWFDKLVAKVQAIASPIQTAWSDMWVGLATTVENIAEGIANTFKGIVNVFIDGINAAIGAIDAIHVTLPSWLPGFGGDRFGVDIPLIPQWRANGGDVTAGSPYIVGERGPELFFPQVSGQVMDNASSQKWGRGAVNNFNISGAVDPDAVAMQVFARFNRLGV